MRRGAVRWVARCREVLCGVGFSPGPGQVRLDQHAGLGDDGLIARRLGAEGELEERVGGFDADQDRPEQIFVRGAPQMAGEQVGQPVRDAVVGVGGRIVHGGRSAEVDEREAGDGALHLEVFVEHGVDGTAPVGGRDGGQAAGDALRVTVQVAPGQGVGEGALVGEEPVDGSDRDFRACGDGPVESCS